MAWSLSRSRGRLHNVHYVHARDSIGHVKKCLYGKYSSDIHGGSVDRASFFHAEDVGSNFSLIIFFFLKFFFLLFENSLISFKANKYM